MISYNRGGSGTVAGRKWNGCGAKAAATTVKLEHIEISMIRAAPLRNCLLLHGAERKIRNADWT